MRRTLTAGVVLAMAGAAFGQNWNEQGDAPDGFAGVQETVGSGSLETIVGSTATGDNNFVDAYTIRIKDPNDWYATTATAADSRASAGFDTRLWLFDLNGNGVVANDDYPATAAPFTSMISDTTTFANLISNDGFIDPNVGTVVAGQKYILIISGYSNDPADAAGTDMFNLGLDFNGLFGPDPAAGAFAGWDNTLPASGSYTIAFKNVNFGVPTPGALSVLGLGGLMAARRRR